MKKQNFVNQPSCNPNKETGAPITPDKYNPIPIGEIAYLWVPHKIKASDIKSLIIRAHGTKKEVENISYDDVLKENRVTGYRALEHTTPSAFNILFYVEDKSFLVRPLLNKFYDKIFSATVIDRHPGGSLCYDYSLSKCANLIDQNGVLIMDKNYSTIQEFLNRQYNQYELNLKTYTESLDALKASKEKIEEQYQQSIESHSLLLEDYIKRLDKYDEDINTLELAQQEKSLSSTQHRELSDLYQARNIENSRIEKAIAPLEKKEASLNAVNNNIELLKQDIEHTEKKIEAFSCILTMRNRSAPELKDITLK